MLKRPLRPNRRAAHSILSAVPLAKGPATSAPLDWPPPTAAAARTHHSAKPPAPTTYSWPGFTLAPAAWAPARATRGKHTCAGEEGEEQGADKLSRHLFLVLPVLPGIHKLTAPTTARNMHARRQCQRRPPKPARTRAVPGAVKTPEPAQASRAARGRHAAAPAAGAAGCHNPALLAHARTPARRRACRPSRRRLPAPTPGIPAHRGGSGTGRRAYQPGGRAVPEDLSSPLNTRSLTCVHYYVP